MLALSVRIALITSSNHSLRSDEIDYQQLAESIREDHSYSTHSGATAYRSPGYPAFISVLMSAVPAISFVLLIQALLETVTCLLLYRIGSIVANSATGFIAAGIWAFFPSSLLMPGLLLSETLFTTILIGALYTIVTTPNRTVILGILFGLTILIKPQMVIVTGAYSVWLLCNKEWKKLFVIVSMMCVLVLPWIVRNIVVMGEPVISTNGGVNFWIGNNLDANGSYKIPKVNPLDSIAKEVNRNSEGYREGWKFITTHPLHSAVLAGKKIAYLWSSQHYLLMLSRDGIDPSLSYREHVRTLSLGSIVLMNLPYILLVIYGIAGFFFISMHNTNIRTLLLVLIFLWMIIHCLYFGSARFNYPLLPILALTASIGYLHRRDLRLLDNRQRILFTLLAGIFLVVLTAELLMTTL